MKLNYISRKKSSIKNDFYKLDFSHFKLLNSKLSFHKEKYICISYAWENISSNHPYYENIKISDRTLGVLQTAYSSYDNISDKEREITIDKMWIDSLCIPINKTDAEFHYSLMGEIYANSSLVFVILSKKMESVLHKIRNSIRLSDEDFKLLNDDKWVSRYWTYQEIVNSNEIYFNSENSTNKPIFASDFFDNVAKDIEYYIRKYKLSVLEFQKKYPFLTSLEAVILDWRIMDNQKRSVYQIMVNMEYRTSDFSSSKLKAMFGCITNDLNNFIEKDDYLTFIKLCENKDDYSFIYNNSLNRHKNKQTWKPILFDFKPIYPWLYCWGEGQKGKVTSEYLELHDMVLYQKSEINSDSLKLLKSILLKNDSENVDIVDVLRRNLTELDFKGTFNPIELHDGYFFNQFKVQLTEDFFIGISKGISWTFGAPGMLLKKNVEKNTYDFISSGVFFGKKNKEKTTLTSIKIK